MVWGLSTGLSAGLFSEQIPSNRAASQFPSGRLSPGRRSADFFGIHRKRSFNQLPLRIRSIPFKFKRDAVVTTTPAFPSMTADELQSAYGSQGLRFFDVDDVVAADLKLENGCKVRLVLSGARITSYKAHMWHGGEDELLHTVRSGRGKLSAESLRGGIDLRFFYDQDTLRPMLWPSAESWSVEDVRCNPADHAQITLTRYSNPHLGNTDAVRGSLQFRYVVTLTRQSLSSALIVTNAGLQPVEFTGSIVTYLAVGSVDGAFAVGLNGCSYRSLSPVPAQGVDKPSADRMFFPGTEQGGWKVENEDYSTLQGGEGRLYPTPPTSFTLLDRGMRRSLILQRLGFEEFCLSNPGPDSKLHDWDDFICLGPAQTKCVRLLENEEWRAAQILVNPGYD